MEKLTENWHRLRQLFDELADEEPIHQQRHLEVLKENEPDVHDQLIRLLEFDARSRALRKR